MEMITRKREKLLVPVELLRYGIRNRCLPKIKLYLYLKYISNGRISDFSIASFEVRDILGIKTEITGERHLEWLRTHHLINYDMGEDILFLRGWGRLYSVFGFIGKTGVFLNRKDFNDFREFAFSAVVGWMVNRQEKREWKRDRKKRRSLPSSRSRSAYPGHSNIVISRELNLSKGMVSRLKKSAVKNSYLKTQPKFEQLNLGAEYYRPYLKSFPE